MKDYTIQEAKEEFAKSLGYNDWEDSGFINCDPVAELYSSKQRENDLKRIEDLEEELLVTKTSLEQVDADLKRLPVRIYGWLNSWWLIKDTVIPIRFKEDYMKDLNL
jgi:hypothetical protein